MIRESEGRYRALFQQSRDAVLMSDSDGALVDVSQGMVDLFGYTREELLTFVVTDLYVDPPELHDFLREITATESVKEIRVGTRVVGDRALQ